jgi:hypothetical protein
MRLTLPRLCPFAFRPTPCRSAPKYPRPRPGTAERPPYRAPDPLLNNPKATVTQLGGKDGEQELTFIHRPPPSAPSPYSLSVAPASPLLRPRSHALGTTETETRQPESPSSSLLPPPIRSQTQKEESPRMSDEDLARLKYLRRSDPFLYTRGKLAKMFGCSPTFVGMVAPLKKSQCRATHKVLEEQHEKAKARWSEKHQIVMEIRKKRKELW